MGMCCVRQVVLNNLHMYNRLYWTDMDVVFVYCSAVDTLHQQDILFLEMLDNFT